MARINAATLGIRSANGQFVVGAQLKIFGPHGRVERPSDQVDIELSQTCSELRPDPMSPLSNLRFVCVRPRAEYKGQLPQRVLNPPQCVLQVLWRIEYDVGRDAVLPRPDGSDRSRAPIYVMQSWQIPRNFDAVMPMNQSPGRTGPRLGLTLTRLNRTAPVIRGVNRGLTVLVDATDQDIQTGVNSGEIISRLSVQVIKSTTSTISVTVQGAATTTRGLGAQLEIGSSTSRETSEFGVSRAGLFFLIRVARPAGAKAA